LKDPRRIRDATDRLIPDVAGAGIARADVIIEAIFENLDAKRGLFAALESKAKPGAILATNTSSIPLEEIATGMRDPSRLIGIHFFNPVPQMMLVEVVVGKNTRADLVPKTAAFVRQIDKLPLPVKSAPGFPRQPRPRALPDGGNAMRRRRHRTGNGRRSRLSFGCRWVRSSSRHRRSRHLHGGRQDAGRRHRRRRDD
jgi:hypothetical protein